MLFLPAHRSPDVGQETNCLNKIKYSFSPVCNEEKSAVLHNPVNPNQKWWPCFYILLSTPFLPTEAHCSRDNSSLSSFLMSWDHLGRPCMAVQAFTWIPCYRAPPCAVGVLSKLRFVVVLEVTNVSKLPPFPPSQHFHFGQQKCDAVNIFSDTRRELCEENVFTSMSP